MAFNFVLPVINVTTDPTWSQEFLDAFNSISTHTHTGLAGDAAQINAANLLLTQDFSLGGYNTINARSYIMQNLVSDPAGANDVCSLYSKNGNLYFNNQLGTHVQVTNGNTINAVSTVASAWSYLTVITNFTLQNSDGYTYLAVNTSGARSVFLPAASTVPTGRFVIIKDATGNSETNAITLVPNGADTIDTSASSYVVKKKFGSWMLVSNGTNGWLVSNYSNKELNDGTIRSNGSGISLIGGSENITTTAATIASTSTAATNITATTNLNLNAANIISTSTAATTISAATISSTSTAGTTISAATTLALNSTTGNVTIDSVADTLVTATGNLTLYSVGGTLTNTAGVINFSANQINIASVFGVRSANDLHVNLIRTYSGTLLTLGQSGSTVAITNQLTVGGTSSLSATNVSGDVNVSGYIDVVGLLNAHGNVSIGDTSSQTLTVNSVASFEAATNINNNITLGSNSSHVITVNGKINTAVQYTTNGVPTEPFLVLPNSNSSININNYVSALIPNTTTGTRTYTVSGSPVAGSYLYIYNNDSGSHNIVGLFSTTLGSGDAIKAMYDGTTWYTHYWFL